MPGIALSPLSSSQSPVAPIYSASRLPQRDGDAITGGDWTSPGEQLPPEPSRPAGRIGADLVEFPAWRQVGAVVHCSETSTFGLGGSGWLCRTRRLS